MATIVFMGMSTNVGNVRFSDGKLYTFSWSHMKQQWQFSGATKQENGEYRGYTANLGTKRLAEFIAARDAALAAATPKVPISLHATITHVETRNVEGFATSGTIRFGDGLQDAFVPHYSGFGYIDGAGNRYQSDRYHAISEAIETERQTRELTENERRESWIGRWVLIEKLFGGQFSGVITGRMGGFWYAYGSDHGYCEQRRYIAFVADMILAISE